MPIIINRPIVIAEVQYKKFNSVVVRRDPSGNMEAEVHFDVLNEDGAVIASDTLRYSGEEFNAFWQSFNSGKFLYEELVKSETDVTVPDSVEDEFSN